MSIWTWTRWALATIGLALASVPSLHAQTLTTAPTRITTAFPTGSGPDTVARLIAEKLQQRWKQPVIVEARPGGAGVLAINSMKNLARTGNELVMADVGNLSINPLIFKNLKYDPEKELTPVAVTFRTAFFVVVGANSKIHNIREFLAAARNTPNGLFYASNAVGGPVHLASAQLAAELGVPMSHVAFKEASQMTAAIATGEVDWAFLSIATLAPMIAAGKVRLLAVADRARSPAAPDVPTLAEGGGPKHLDAFAWNAIMAPAGTPPAIISEINRGVIDALAQPDVREKLANFSFTPMALTPQQVAELIRGDREKYADVIKRVKISID
jgi:tripartite-type tricarboxylate transporter receptor subunit TctC